MKHEAAFLQLICFLRSPVVLGLTELDLFINSLLESLFVVSLIFFFRRKEIDVDWFFLGVLVSLCERAHQEPGLCNQLLGLSSAGWE